MVITNTSPTSARHVQPLQGVALFPLAPWLPALLATVAAAKVAAAALLAKGAAAAKALLVKGAAAAQPAAAAAAAALPLAPQAARGRVSRAVEVCPLLPRARAASRKRRAHENGGASAVRAGVAAPFLQSRVPLVAPRVASAKVALQCRHRPTHFA